MGAHVQRAGRSYMRCPNGGYASLGRFKSAYSVFFQLPWFSESYKYSVVERVRGTKSLHSSTFVHLAMHYVKIASLIAVVMASFVAATPMDASVCCLQKPSYCH